MRHIPRNSVALVRRFVVVVGIGLAMWLGATPTAAQVPTVPGHECDNVPHCQVKRITPFQLSGWDTLLYDFYCRGEYPYFWAFSYTQSGHPSVSNIASSASDYPDWVRILFTNWNPFQTDDVFVTLACSKDNKWANECGGGVFDPGCPQVPGSEKDFCNNTRLPICVSTYEERCPDTKQLYRCTIEFGLSWCQPCPG
jgi:hypothetical protein